MVKIVLEAAREQPDPETAARRARYRSAANEELRSIRARRLKALTARTGAVERAMTAYAGLPTRPDVIAVRAGFVALDQPRKLPPSAGGELYRESDTLATRRRIERQSRPPATQLIAERSRALPTAMSMLYVAQCEGDERGRFRNHHAVAMNNSGPSWASLAGRYHHAVRTRRARMCRDLDHLAEVGLVAIKEHGQGRYEAFKLNREDSVDGRYRVPSKAEGPLLLPGALFTNGWHLVLEPDELALYLAINHLHATVTKQPNVPGLALTSRIRFATYGLSSEAYNAIHELEEFGLITTHDPMPHRRRGKVRPPTQAELDAAAESETSLAPVPYLLELVPEALERPALEVVLPQLDTFVLPPRVMELDDMLDAKYSSVPIAPPLKGAVAFGPASTPIPGARSRSRSRSRSR